ncbi:CHAT domain-containing protein [Mariniflexile sp.]|uniref:CHAT domain-containing protein n=1 Tax=Mariniflexile sp. TaxID=1979402 RepID=UPI00356AF7B8
MSFAIFYNIKTNAQKKDDNSNIRLNQLIESDSINKALTEITQSINYLKSNKKFESLGNYIYPLGKIYILKKDPHKAKILSKELLDIIENTLQNKKIRYHAHIEFSKLCLELNTLPEALEHATIAKSLAYSLNNSALKLESEYYLADFSMKMGQIDNLEKHIRKANHIIKQNKKTTFKISARVYNLMGALMYYHSKQDSAIYYFEKSLKNIPLLENNPENNWYLPAALKGNLALIKLNQAKPKEAKALIESSIKLSLSFLDHAKNNPLANRVKRNLLIGYATLNGIYYDLGDFEKSEIITTLALNFAKNTQEYFMAYLGAAQVKTEKREFEEALSYLEKANESLKSNDSENHQLYAFLYDNYGLVKHLQNKTKDAVYYWEKSWDHYIKSNPYGFDVNQIFSNMNLAIAYSEINEKKKAIATIDRLYNYVNKTEGEKSYLIKAIMLTYAKVYLNLEQYERSIYWSNKCIALYKERNALKGLGKVYFEDNKADIYLVNAQAKYYNEELRDSTFLKNILSSINTAIKAIENRKTSLSSAKDVNTLVENNSRVFDFAKKINLELYKSTKEPAYLEKAISLHESGLYNRIRFRLNSKPISFLNIPKETTKREDFLKNSLNNKDGNIDSFISNSKSWQQFLDSLKNNHPKYYKMRYATLELPLDNIVLPKNTCIVRYLYIDTVLYAFIVSQNDKKIYELSPKETINNYIAKLQNSELTFDETASKLHHLYNILWKPFASDLTTQNIVIIPDKNLFNLSFETLTPKKIKSFKEFAQNSLLSKYNLSYNYSLFLLTQNQTNTAFKTNFISFAPEFTHKMKANYKRVSKDSLSIDVKYDNLLPQPFSADLSRKYSKLFNGISFINEKASKKNFQNEAGGNKIIYIGTHAESNNLFPEQSRLIFAKNKSSEDNTLYAFEIYNENLKSKLAILSACETGKPTYQPGEGMISLAHAFNYAGSESIVTGLWKIDEKSSTRIVELFLNNLKQGMHKDKALKEAKLTYLTESYGRTLSPEYWSGLILIGDTNPLILNTNSNIIWWIGILLAVSILTIIFLLKQFVRRKKAIK